MTLEEVIQKFEDTGSLKPSHFVKDLRVGDINLHTLGMLRIDARKLIKACDSLDAFIAKQQGR